VVIPAQHFRPDNVVISLAGRITPADAIAFGKRVLWGPAERSLLTLMLPHPYPQPDQTMTPANRRVQSIVMLGHFSSLLVQKADYAAFEVTSLPFRGMAAYLWSCGAGGV